MGEYKFYEVTKLFAGHHILNLINSILIELV